VVLVVLNIETGPKFGPCYIQRLRKYTSFCGDCHEICVTDPPRQYVHVDVVSDTGTCGLPEVEPHVKTSRLIDLAKCGFGALGERYQFVGGLSGNSGERCKVRIGQDHHMTRRVRVGIQAHEAVQTAVNDVDRLFCFIARHPLADGVVDGGNYIAKNAMFIFSIGWRPRSKCSRNASPGLAVFTGDIAVAPWSPEAIHSPSIAEGSGFEG
jgi:hypothetical protein